MHPTVADTRPLRRRGAALASTYRLQLRTPDSDPDGGGLTLDDAAGLVPYLARLGVGAVYLSPILTATPGSTHGYDVVDPTTVSAGLGGPDALRRLRAACREHGLGLVVDIVPNHLGVDSPRDNAAWWDVLRLGSDSSYAGWFDVDWSTDNGCDGRIALPVLGAPEDVDALEVDRSGDEPELRFYEHRFPVAPGTGEGSPREVHDRQHYRLVHWREPLLGYRRFFTVTGLAGLRQEDAEVFDSTHVEVARWCAEDLVDGIRVDHPDGLADPIGYTRRLRDLAGDDRGADRLRDRGELKDRVRVDRLRLADLAHPEALRVGELAIGHHRHGNAGDAGAPHRIRHQIVELADRGRDPALRDRQRGSVSMTSAAGRWPSLPRTTAGPRSAHRC